jgi:hypothetical protein
MALAICPALQGQRSLRRIRQVLSWAFAQLPGLRSLAWARLASFCDGGLAGHAYVVIDGTLVPIGGSQPAGRSTRPAAPRSHGVRPGRGLPTPNPAALSAFTLVDGSLAPGWAGR